MHCQIIKVLGEVTPDIQLTLFWLHDFWLKVLIVHVSKGRLFIGQGILYTINATYQDMTKLGKTFNVSNLTKYGQEYTCLLYRLLVVFKVKIDLFLKDLGIFYYFVFNQIIKVILLCTFDLIFHLKFGAASFFLFSQ